MISVYYGNEKTHRKRIVCLFLVISQPTLNFNYRSSYKERNKLPRLHLRV